jgi:hypothetical protein
MARHPSGTKKEGKDDLPIEGAESENGSGGATEYKGLCANCVHRDSCLLPKSEGGVWHCEEYLEES